MSTDNNIINPFTEEDRQRWINAERNLERLLQFMDRAEYCGVNCEEYRTIAQTLRERFARLRQTFFPGM